MPLVVIAGKEYGTGSSRDWAAKGTRCSACKAVIAESFERIHRSNLVGMGVLPLQFTGGDTARRSASRATRRSRSPGSAGDLKPLSEVPAIIVHGDGTSERSR